MQQIVFSSSVSIDIARDFPVGRDRLWHVLTSGPELSEILRYPCTLEPRLGGRFTITARPGSTSQAIICHFDAGHCFAVFWKETTICLRIQQPQEHLARLCIRQTGIHPDAAVQFASGWHCFLDGVDNHLGGHTEVHTDAELGGLYGQQFQAFAQTHGITLPA